MTTLADYMKPDEIDNLIGPVCELADLETTAATDPLMDQLILVARKVRDREGFLVVDGDV